MKGAALVVLALLLAGAALMIVSPALAEAFLFFPDRSDAGEPPPLAGVQGRVVTLRTEDGVPLRSWWYAPPGDGPVVLFLHGNAGSIRHRTPLVRGLLERGVGVLLLEYRGYGGNDGEPTLDGVVLDARAGWTFVRERAGSGGRAAIFGRSLGAAVAAQVVARATPEEEPAALVLESTFTSLREMAEAAYPLLPSFVFRRLEGHLDTSEVLRGLGVPILVVHGGRDTLIPPSMGRALHDAAGEGARWLEVADAGHNDVFVVGGGEYFDTVARFVRDAVGRRDAS